jgi:hypothetical protein
VFRIRIETETNADPDSDPDFYLIADPDPGCQTKADPCGFGSRFWSDVAIAKSWMKNILMLVKCHKTYRAYVGTKTILKALKSALFVNFGQFLVPGSGSAFPI